MAKVKPLPRHVDGPTTVALAGVVYEWRLKRNWTQAELARRAGISRQMISYIETCNRNLSLNMLERVSRGFGMWGLALHKVAETRARRWPECCIKCNYGCVDRGRRRWWNRPSRCFCSGR